MTSLPAPRATFSGIMWLPRILEKARRTKINTLPPEFAVRFGAPDGTDGQFLSFFHLTAEQILEICDLPVNEIAAWFSALPGVDEDRIAAWNELAVNLGRTGYPMAERLPIGLATTYSHLDAQKIHSVFEMIEADEGVF